MLAKLGRNGPRDRADVEFLDLLHHSRSTWSATLLALVPFGRDERPMPGEDRIRGDDTGEERLSADRTSWRHLKSRAAPMPITDTAPVSSAPHPRSMTVTTTGQSRISA